MADTMELEVLHRCANDGRWLKARLDMEMELDFDKVQAAEDMAASVFFEHYRALRKERTAC